MFSRLERERFDVHSSEYKTNRLSSELIKGLLIFILHMANNPEIKILRYRNFKLKLFLVSRALRSL